jgi:hypothetical protein
VINVEPHTARLSAGQLSLLTEQFADLLNVSRVFDAEVNVEVEHEEKRVDG